MLDAHESRQATTKHPPNRPVPEVLWIAGVVIVYLALALALAAQGTPFGHDEAVYSLRARHLVQDAPPVFYWIAYRAPGLPFALQIAWLGPATEPFLRLVVAVFGIPLILSTWFVGRTLLGVRVGLVAAAGVALTPTVLTASTQVWPDVPGAAIGMTAIAVYMWALSRSRVSPWVLFVPVLVFVATMLRFGAPVPIAIGLVGITIWGRRTALASWPLVLTAAVLTAIAASAVLYLPATTSWAQFGDPVAPASAIATAQSSSFSLWIQTLVDYWGYRNHLLGGFVGVLAIVGIAAGTVTVSHRPALRSGYWTTVGIAATTLGALTWLLHAEARYLVAAYPWIWIAAALGLVALVPHLDRRVVVAGIVLGVAIVVVDSYGRAGVQNDFNAANYQRIKEAAGMIDDATPDGRCSVLSSYVPQVGWYSKCPTKEINTEKVVLDSPWFPNGPRYLYLAEGGKRQPEGVVLEEYVAATTGPVFTAGDPTEGRRRYVEVYQVDQ